MSGHILAIGSINMDLVIRTPHYPQPGETVMGGSFQTFPGGKGANQSVAAARLGANVVLIGRVGKDGFGDALLQTIKNDGVDIRYIQRDAIMPTGVAFILVDNQDGQNVIVLAEGANGNISTEDVFKHQEVFEDAKVLMMNFECPLPALEKAIHLAKQKNIPVVLNPAPYHPFPAAMLAQIDYLITNQIEISQLLGANQMIEDIQQIVEAVREHKQLNNVIITLGEKGALVIEKGNSTHIEAYKVTPVDTVAAGDAFIGAFSVAIAEGKPSITAACWGNAAGALAVTKRGAQPSLPTRADLLSLLGVSS